MFFKSILIAFQPLRTRTRGTFWGRSVANGQSGLPGGSQFWLNHDDDDDNDDDDGDDDDGQGVKGNLRAGTAAAWIKGKFCDDKK